VFVVRHRSRIGRVSSLVVVIVSMFNDLLLNIVVKVGKFNVLTTDVMSGKAGDTVDDGSFD